MIKESLKTVVHLKQFLIILIFTNVHSIACNATRLFYFYQRSPRGFSYIYRVDESAHRFSIVRTYMSVQINSGRKAAFTTKKPSVRKYHQGY